MELDSKITKLGPFLSRISVASNTIKTIDNETDYLIIFCWNCLRRDGHSTYLKRAHWCANVEVERKLISLAQAWFFSPFRGYCG